MNEFELTQTHIQLLRKVVIFWDATEGGRPLSAPTATVLRACSPTWGAF